MKKFLTSMVIALTPFLVFAEAEVTDQDMLTIFKVIGCLILALLIPGIIIGLICAGIRTIRGILNI